MHGIVRSSCDLGKLFQGRKEGEERRGEERRGEERRGEEEPKEASKQAGKQAENLLHYQHNQSIILRPTFNLTLMINPIHPTSLFDIQYINTYDFFIPFSRPLINLVSHSLHFRQQINLNQQATIIYFVKVMD